MKHFLLQLGVTLWAGALVIPTTLEAAAGSMIMTESSTFGSSDDTVLTSVVNPGGGSPPLACTFIFVSKSSGGEYCGLAPAKGIRNELAETSVPECSMKNDTRHP